LSQQPPGSIDRVGIGTDLHRLVPGRPLVIGHVEVPHELGCLGHSDGDVVLHAVIDALAGAAGLPDIGEMFPDTDLAYRNADSGELLRVVVERLAERSFGLVNLDVTVHAERPKLGPYKSRIREEIARLLQVPADRVSIKAKTHEGVDAVGRGEAIACTAIVGLRLLKP
jgi:2-C-methyl-D-erythritol 2,4-cyclodiphosphate synthase